MNKKMLIRCLNVAVCGLAAATFFACSDDDGGGSGGAGGTPSGSSSSTTSGSGGSTSSSSSSSSSSTGGGSPVDSTVIDDMEDGDAAIAAVEDRLGYWYTFHDATANATQTPDGTAFVMEPLPAPRDGSTKAAHTTGSGFMDYVGIGFNFKLMGTDKVVYDASGYTGITFWAKKAQGSDGGIRVTLPDVNTDPAGAVCTTGCFDHFGTDIALTEDWAEYTLPFADLAQGGFGDPAPAAIDATKVYGVQFQLVPATGDFDYWIDDIAFTK